MKFLVLLIFCSSVKSVPVKGQLNVSRFAFEKEIDNEVDSHYLGKKSVSNQCSNLQDLEDNENFEEPSRLSLNTLMTLSNEDAPQDLDVDKILSGMIYQPMDLMLAPEFEAKPLMLPLPTIMPRTPLPWPSWMNDIKYIQEPTHDIHNRLPYQLPSYISENTVPSVRSLPPVSMQIHETLSEIENNYETDDSDMDKGVYLTPNVRAVRSREEEFLEHLKHEAMIPNIIPTMPVLFMRTAGAPPVYQAGQDAPLMMVIFPGKVSDCALPFLFGCSPDIAYGRLADSPDDGYQPIPSAVPNPEYRKEPDTAKNEVN